MKKQFTPKQKAAVALEALREMLTMCDIPVKDPETKWERAVNAGHAALAALTTTSAEGER